MALFGRKRLPDRCTLSRYLAALDQPTVEALRALFLDDVVLRTAQTFPAFRVVGSSRIALAGRRCGWYQTSRTAPSTARASLSSCSSSPLMPCVCAPAYLGRKRGEVARTRTPVLQAHSHHWSGSFGGSGNGDYCAELARACEAIIS
jgi:hypothetical protein